ncbi:MAG: alpha/beta fold hydrolase [Cyanobacteria bacterium HKST-UBA02]|nr:alpha/beta fold hydrolase [Cyanobacteria bacterium HKST-UBA02]
MRLFLRLCLCLLAVGFISLAFTYLSFSPRFCHGLVNKAMFHPQKVESLDKSLALVEGIEAREVDFHPSGTSLSLKGLLYRVPESEDIVLFSHGNGGNLNYCRSFLQAVLKAKVSVFAYDYRGYGMSQGSPSVDGVMDDAKAAYDYLRDRLGYESSRIVLYGSSLGGGVSTQLARLRQCKAIMLDSTFQSPEFLVKERFPIFNIYPGFLWFRPALDNLDFVSHSNLPLLIMVARNDVVIPWTHSRSLARTAAGSARLVVFDHSKHSDFDKDFDGYCTAISGFLGSAAN